MYVSNICCSALSAGGLDGGGGGGVECRNSMLAKHQKYGLLMNYV